MSKVRFLVFGDLHGEIPKIKNLEKIDAIITTGDFCGWSGGDLECMFCEESSQNRGRKVLKWLNSLGKEVFVVPGNWEPTTFCDGMRKNRKNIYKEMIKNLKNICDVEYGLVVFGGVTLIGFGSTSSPEPLMAVKRRKFESEMSFKRRCKRVEFFKRALKKLEKIFSKARYPVIFLSHNSPYNTKLDKISDEHIFLGGKHYGSRVTRKLILKHSPMICISGHIHEGKGVDVLGKTKCMNVGSGKYSGAVVEIDTKKNKITRCKFLKKVL